MPLTAELDGILYELPPTVQTKTGDIVGFTLGPDGPGAYVERDGVTIYHGPAKPMDDRIQQSRNNLKRAQALLDAQRAEAGDPIEIPMPTLPNELRQALHEWHEATGHICNANNEGLSCCIQILVEHNGQTP